MRGAAALITVLMLVGCTNQSPSTSPSASPFESSSLEPVSTPTAAPTVPEADAERLLLVSRAPLDFTTASNSLWVIPADGSEPWLVGDGPPQAQWSPGGTRVFMIGQGPDCTPQVTSLNPDGTDPTVLPFDLRIGDAGFQWSPDGRHVAFSRTTDAVECRHSSVLAYEPWVMNADGSDQHRLASDGVVSWSPAGDRLAVARASDPNAPWDSLAVVDPTGAVLASLGPEPGVFYLGRAAWSPDGNMLAFSRTDGEASNIYVADADLTDVSPLIPSDVPERMVGGSVWLPGSQALLFTASDEDGRRLWTIGSDGGGLRMVSLEEVSELEWALSPSGESIARTGLADDGSPALILMDLNGVTLSVLLDGVEMRWQPDLHAELDQP